MNLKEILQHRHGLGLTRAQTATAVGVSTGTVGETRIVERAFGLGPCALTEAMVWLRDRPACAWT